MGPASTPAEMRTPCTTFSANGMRVLGGPEHVKISNKSTITVYNKPELVFNIKINSTKVFSRRRLFANRSFFIQCRVFLYIKTCRCSAYFGKSTYRCPFQQQTSKRAAHITSDRTLLCFNIPPSLYNPKLLHVQDTRE
jgi:hypothetical protein